MFSKRAGQVRLPQLNAPSHNMSVQPTHGRGHTKTSHRVCCWQLQSGVTGGVTQDELELLEPRAER